MTNDEYNKLLLLSKRYIKSGRDFYSDITPEELLTETLIYIADNNITEELSERVFWKCLIKTRSKMIKDILKQRPELKLKHLYLVRKYYAENKEKIKERFRLKQIQNGWKINPVGSPKGLKHGKSVGIYSTPFGEFESSYEAAKIIGLSHRCIQYRCKSNSSKFKDWNIKCML